MSIEKYGEHSSGFTYDVFLSFRGEDVRHSFIGYLRDALQHRGINAFFDDNNLRIGEDISPALSKAIEESKIAVIVFSENYASSRWCLGELVKIIECTKRNKKQIAFPIFFHVDPSDVRHQGKSYAEAMIAHEIRFGKDSENVKAWTAALSEAADLKGHHINTGSEIDHIKEIVEKVHANITPKPLLSGNDPVGLEHHTEKVKSLLDNTDNTVCMLGICGIGGIGKTELAKSLYNKIVHQFEAASFLAKVSEKSNKINGLEDLQKTLLSEMFEKPDTELGSPSKGMKEIKQKLGKKKVLLVLDDVDGIKQLENLAGGSDWFGPGSKIVITTRDKGLLKGPHAIRDKYIYEMTELNDQHSLELFCRKAFGMNHPETGYEALSSRAVGYAKGLPLALIVIGSNLGGGKSLRAWENALKSYDKIPHGEIQQVLQVSYKVLEPNAQSVFLDIACFFKGDRIDYVEEILDDFAAVTSIEELVDKSLLIVKDGCLDMHDLIQEMGRDIVKQESPQNPAKRSRLWSHKDIIKVLSDENYGTGSADVLQGIKLDPPQPIKQQDWSDTVFKKMNCLRILIVRNTTFSSEPKHLPKYLNLLDWEEYPSKSFPPMFHPEEIIVFNLPESKLTLEEPFKVFSKLTIMNFTKNESITAMPDVSGVENLRVLRLDKCKNLTMVHESVGFLENLTHLSASGCPKLRKFPQRMFLPSLEFLDLNLCVELEHFPDIVNKMNRPLKIYMINTAIEKLPDSIGNLIGLVSIEMTSSWKLKYIPCSLFTLPNAVTFKFGGCSQLGESLRRFLHHIPSAANGRSTLKTLHFGNSGLSDEDLKAILISFLELEELIASDNNFISLPVCIKDSAHLSKLDVSGCNKLREIPECTNLRSLNVYGCVMLEHISELPCTIQKVDARYCFRLNRETSDMLWNQVKSERCGLQMVMETGVPNLFDYRCKGGNPRFWVGKKFPNVALALVFQGVTGRSRKSRRLLVELHLVINGLCVPRKGYYNFRIEQNHVLVCDLRLLFSDEEWLGLDALLKDEWNQVQVSYEAPSNVTLSDWGVFVYKQGTNMKEYVKFMCPDLKYSQLVTDISPTMTIVPPKDDKLKQRKLIDQLALDDMLAGMLRETRDMEGRSSNEGNLQELMAIVSGLNKEAQDALEGKPLDDKKSPLAWILRIVNESKDDEDEQTNFDHTDEMKPAIGVGEASSSGHQGSSEAQQDSNVEQDEIMTGIFLNGMGTGLREAHSIFPSLDVDTIMIAALNKGEWVRLSLPESEVEMKIYMEGIINGLLEAKLSFPTLKEWEILNTVLRKESHDTMFQPINWTEIVVPSYDDPLLQAFMMMEQGSCESERAKSKLFCKLLEEQNALRKKFEEIENEIATMNNSKKGHSLNEKLAAVLKGRAEELQRLYDAGIEGFQNSKEIQDLMTATYSNGMRNGVLEAQAILLALDMDIITHVFEGNENEISAQDKDSRLLPSSENQYYNFVEKLNTQFSWYSSNKDQSPDGTDEYDCHTKESSISDSKSSLGSTKICADIGKESCKDVIKHKKLAAVLKERGEELTSLYEAEIEQFQNSEEIQDLMSATYLSGLRDGVLEAQATLLSLNMDGTPYPYGCFWRILHTCFCKCFS